MAKSYRRVDAQQSHVSAALFVFLAISHVKNEPRKIIDDLCGFFSPYGGTSSDHTVQKLVLGTHTSNDEQNYLQIVTVSVMFAFGPKATRRPLILVATHTDYFCVALVQVKLPLESSKDTRDYKENVLDDNTNGIGGKEVIAAK